MHTLVPIAAVYVLAHYFSLLAYNGQSIAYLASDPLGKGWDLFGTADKAIDYGVIGATAIWYVQVGVLVAGHVCGLILAHDRALALYGKARAATTSQYWMLAVMVALHDLRPIPALAGEPVMLPLAHAGHVLVDLLTVLPVFVLILWFVWITIRDRRRGDVDEPETLGHGPHGALPARPAGGAVRARRADPRPARIPRAAAGSRCRWYGGLALMGIALLSPLDSLGETDLLSAHMAQHLLIADLSAPLLVIGLRTPVYAFLLPRALFAELARSDRLRAAVPVPASSRWWRRRSGSSMLYGWHLAPAYEAALRSPVLHALQHQTFIVASLLLWVSVLEPARRRVPGELWKIAHIVGTRFAGMFLGMAFVILQRPIYEGFYGQPGARARPHAGGGPADRRRPDAGRSTSW